MKINGNMYFLISLTKRQLRTYFLDVVLAVAVVVGVVFVVVVVVV